MKMKHWIIAGAILLVILIVLVAFPFLIDINSFRPHLETEASVALGRKVKLGNLSLSILTGSIGADDIEIADDPAFGQQNFLTAKSVKIDVAMHPLIYERKVEVKGIDILRPHINLLRDDKGNWNFASLGNAARGNQRDSSTNLPRISVARFRAEDGVISLGELNSTRLPRVFDHFQLEVKDFTSDLPVHFKLSASLPGGGDAGISGSAGPINRANTAQTPIDVSLKVNNLHIAAYGLVDPASGIDGIANIDENLRSDGTKATIAGAFNGSHMKLAPRGKPTSTEISIQQSIDLDIASRSGTLTQSDIAVGKAHLHASGNFQDHAGKQLVDLRLIGTDMPIDELQSIVPALDIKTPNNSTMRGGTASIKLRVFGPPADLTIQGHIATADTTQVGFSLGSQLGSVSSFAGKTITSPDTAVKSLSFDTTVTRVGVAVDNIDVDIPSVSTATGSGTITPDGKLSFAVQSYPTSGMAGRLQRMSSVGGSKGYVPMTITGTVEKPVFTADVHATTRIMASQTAKGVEHAIGNLFKKKPKDQTGSATQTPPTAPPK